MNIVHDVFRELLGMFVADARLTTAILALVAAVATLLVTLHIEPLIAGGVLLIGSLAILVAVVHREARRRTRSNA